MIKKTSQRKLTYRFSSTKKTMQYVFNALVALIFETFLIVKRPDAYNTFYHTIPQNF